MFGELGGAREPEQVRAIDIDDVQRDGDPATRRASATSCSATTSYGGTPSSTRVTSSAIGYCRPSCPGA